MPIPQQYRETISQIQQATDEGRVNWQESEQAGSRTRFYVPLSISAIEVAAYQGRSATGAAYTLRFAIVNKDGKMADGFTLEPDDPDHATLWQLFLSARKTARGFDAAISELHRALSSEGPIGKLQGTEGSE